MLTKLENNDIQFRKNKKNENVSRLVFCDDITTKYRLEPYLIDSETSIIGEPFDDFGSVCMIYE